MRPRYLVETLLMLLLFSTVRAQEYPLQPPTLKDEAVAAPVLNLVDLAGGQHKLSDFRGRVVLLNVWGTWCGECVLEMPTLERLSTRLKDDPKAVIILASFNDSADQIKAFRRAHHLSSQMFLLKNDDLPRRLQLHSFPETFLFGKDGLLRAEHTGAADWSSASVISRIEQLEREPRQR